MNSLEKLRYNLIDDNFFKIFQPVIVVQSVLGYARINVKNKYISGTSILQRLYAIAAMCISSYFWYMLTIIKVSNYFDITYNDPLLRFVDLLQCFITIVKHVFLIINASFMHRNSNAELYVIMQNIDRALNFNKVNGQYMALYRRNLIGVLGIFTLCLLWQILNYDLEFNFLDYIMNFVSILTLFCDDFEMVGLSSILYFLHARLKHINRQLEEKANVKWRHLIRDHEDDYDGDILEAFENITTAFHVVQKVYSPFAFMICAYPFFLFLIIIERLIGMSNTITWTLVVMTGSGLTKMFIIFIYACISNELFYSEAKRTKDSCKHLLYCSSDDKERKVAKNIIRLVKVRMQPFSVYGMFALDAQLPLRLLALTTTYTVVLLQFAFI